MARGPRWQDGSGLALAGIDALDAWTREVGAYRGLSELGVTEGMVDAIADTIVCLPTNFKTLTREDVCAILRESM